MSGTWETRGGCHPVTMEAREEAVTLLQWRLGSRLSPCYSGGLRVGCHPVTMEVREEAVMVNPVWNKDD